MKKGFVYLLFATCSITLSFSQYSTPGTGVVWNLDSLVQNSTAVEFISSNNYRIIEDLTISANDSVFIVNNNVRFANGIQLTISDGSLYALGAANGSLVADLSGQNYKGIRIEGNSHVSLDNVVINNCGGIKVLSPNFILRNSSLENNPSDLNTSGMIEVSTGYPEFFNNVFRNNELSAISSAANATVAPIIKNNIFEFNVSSNTNRPQINLSPSGVNDTTYIENNTITGSSNYEMAGGIAFSALAGGFGNIIIRNNNITDNRYGITVLGNNLHALIDNNQINENNTQGLPNLGGSGINLNGNATSSAIISNNEIKGNLWGVTVLGSFLANLGDSHIGGGNPGGNRFDENGNGGNTYALFNNTSNDINATNNCWSLSSESTLPNAESVISHEVDDNSLGEVIFDPIMLCNGVGMEESMNNSGLLVYPNPVKNKVLIELKGVNDLSEIRIYDLNGALVLNKLIVDKNQAELDISFLKSGVYFVRIKSEGLLENEKIIKL